MAKTIHMVRLVLRRKKVKATPRGAKTLPTMLCFLGLSLYWVAGATDTVVWWPSIVSVIFFRWVYRDGRDGVWICRGAREEDKKARKRKREEKGVR